MGICEVMNSQARAVFFDRDGVLNNVILKNGKPHPPASIAELELAAGAAVALNKLVMQDYRLIGITNQPDVARGTTTKTIVDEINQAIMQQLPLDEILVCFHDDKDDCECRKPKPGLLFQAAKAYDIDLSKSFMIGDRWKDIDAGIAANCKTIWIKTDYKEKQPATMDFVANNLVAAVDWVLLQ